MILAQDFEWSPLRAITLTQPWASLVAKKKKGIETRLWSTSYRGLVAIHAAKTWDAAARALVPQEPFKSALEGLTIETMPLGAIVGVARLTACRLMVEGQAPSHELLGVIDIEAVPEPEKTFGAFAPGRYGFTLEDARELALPVPCKGALSIWAATGAVAERVRAVLEDFEERAGILEHDAGLSRGEAERLARLFMAGPVPAGVSR